MNHRHQEPGDEAPPLPPIRQLLLPHRFSWWGRNWDQIIAAGIPAVNRLFNFWPFPIHAPATVLPRFMHARVIQAGMPQLRFHTLIEMPVSTRSDSHTSIAASVQNFNADNQLHFVKVSDQLWPAFVHFAVGSTPSALPGQDPPADGGFFNTFRANHFPVPMPTLEQQMRSVSSLWGWYITQLTTRDYLVNCELAVQDEIYRQLLFPVNQLLVGRYSSTLGNENPGTFMPAWSRPVEGNRCMTDIKAGIPDFLMYTSVAPKSKSTMCEVKTSWSYERRFIAYMLTRDNYHANGAVIWGDTNLPNQILKQIWSEMVAFDVKFGIWTNGQQIVAVLDTSYYAGCRRVNELTFSRLQDINSNNSIYQGIAGLCFASFEHKLSPNPVAFINTLCPLPWRTVPP